MFAQAVPSSPAISTTSPPASPTGPSRPSRLRGLSYLRNYTQQHLSRDSQHNQTPSSPPQRNSLLRSISYPAPTASSPEPPGTPTSDIGQTSRDTSTAEQGSQEIFISADLDTAGGSINMARNRSGSSQVVTQPTASRRGQSVPRAPPTPEARNFSRLGRTTSSNDPVSTTIAAPSQTVEAEGSGLAGLPKHEMPTIKFIPHQDPRSGKPSLSFPTTSRTLPHEDCVIRVGRYSERDGQPNPPAHLPSSAPVGFKSKVVSRRHCEFWCSQGQWYIKDVKSSSGTFLNHIRLSQPSMESRPFPVNDGDVVQLGIDFRGGEEMIFRCVKIRIECNRAWQKGLNNFNMTTHKRLRALGKSETKKDSDTASTHSSECAICLMSIAPCQSLFVAPCSHVWHYKCIRPMLNDHKTWPQFMCPNCRAMADLEADVDDPPDTWKDDDDDDEDAELAELEDEEGTRPPPSYHDSTSIGDRMETPNLSNAVSLNDNRALNEPLDVDSDLAAQSRQLSITNLAEDKASILNRANANGGPSLISRRMASRPSFGAIGETSPAEPTDADLDNMNLGLGDQDHTLQAHPTTPRGAGGLRTPTPTGGDRHAEALLTPTNDAGPFVFDGSAGRTGGRRVAERPGDESSLE